MLVFFIRHYHSIGIARALRKQKSFSAAEQRPRHTSLGGCPASSRNKPRPTRPALQRTGSPPYGPRAVEVPPQELRAGITKGSSVPRNRCFGSRLNTRDSIPCLVVASASPKVGCMASLYVPIRYSESDGSSRQPQAKANFQASWEQFC